MHGHFSIIPGQKTCLHLHGIFPYLYVVYDGPGVEPSTMNTEAGTAAHGPVGVLGDRYLRQFAASIDKALNVALGRSTSNAQHVYKVVLVKAM